MVFSTTSSSRPDSSSSAFTTSVAAAAVATTVASLAMLIRWKIQQLKNKADQSPVVPGFPSPPGAHWLFGHLILLHHGEGEDDAGGGADFVRGYNAVYEKYADPQSGRGSFWFFTSPSISLLNGRDVKTILTASSYRDSIALFNVHNSNFLGRRALVALMGKEWRLYRSAVHKSFTPAVIRQSQTVICQVGETLVDSLIRETAATASTSGGTSPTPVLPLMKMATIDVFGKAALNVDFACCESLRLSPIAYAFDYLTVEYTRRMQKPWDPFSFLYGIPTKANLEHRRQRGLIRKFIADQISKTRQQIIADRNDGTERGDESSSSPRRSLSSTSTTGDLLSNLIKAADADSKDVSDDALGDIMMTLLFGGYDTTRYDDDFLVELLYGFF
jgi:cytochrome P450